MARVSPAILALLDEVVHHRRRHEGHVERVAAFDLLFQRRGQAVAHDHLVFRRALELREEVLRDRLQAVGTEDRQRRLVGRLHGRHHAGESEHDESACQSHDGHARAFHDILPTADSTCFGGKERPPAR